MATSKMEWPSLDRNIYIDEDAVIQKGHGHPPKHLHFRKTRIGEGVSVGPNSFIKDSILSNGVIIEGFVFMESAELEEGVRLVHLYGYGQKRLSGKAPGSIILLRQRTPCTGGKDSVWNSRLYRAR